METALSECGEWIASADFYGYDIVHTDVSYVTYVESASEEDCRSACQDQPGCNAVTLVSADLKCYLKQIPDGYQARATEGTLSSLHLCEDETKPGPDLIVLNAPGFEIADDVCGEWLWDHNIPDKLGSEVPLDDTSPPADKYECVKRCVSSRPCNTVVFNYRNNECSLHASQPDTPPQSMPDFEVLRLCDLQSPIECGVWQMNKDQYSYDIEGHGGKLQPTADTCIAQCLEIEGCNALVYKKYSKECWPKRVPAEGLWAEPLKNPESDFMLLCPNQILSGRASSPQATAGVLASGATEAPSAASETATAVEIEATEKGLSTAVLVGIVISAVVVLVTVATVLMLLVRRRSRRHTSRHTEKQGSHGAVQLESMARNGDMVRCSHQRALQSPTGATISNSQASRSIYTAAETTPMPTTTWEMSVLPMPGRSCSKDQLMDFVRNQLDRIGASSRKGQHAVLLEGLCMLGSGPSDRLEGGQAIVQMVVSNSSRMEYAVKFFVARDAFEQEKAMYCGPLNRFLPQVRNIIDNDDKHLMDPSGQALPPCIVMERGESLDLWSKRNAPDRSQAFTVIYHIAQRMEEFHSAGYVHRDLKPGNVMWLPSKNRWTVIDFGCAGHTKEVSSISYTLRYAAPEVIRAKRCEEREMVLEEALDAWSLGVMAFEMCTSTPSFPHGTSPESIMDQIEGVNGEMLPWEGERLTPEVRAKLRLFHDALLQLLHRNPQQRPSMKHFCRICAAIVGENTIATSEEVSHPMPSMELQWDTHLLGAADGSAHSS